MGGSFSASASVAMPIDGGNGDANMVARQEKLTSVSASMSTIYKDMEEHTKSRRELHENRLVSIEQSITRLEKHFQGSIKTVRDGLKEASEMFDKRLRDIDKGLKLSSERRAHEVENAVSEIRKNLITIEKKMEEQKELVLRELKETREQIEHQLHEFHVAFDTEKLEARKREEQAQKRLQSSLSKMQERIDIHRGAMESRIKQLKEDIHDANQRHENENMRFEEQVYLEIDLVKKAIETEVDERARSEESIVNSLEHYQTLLQKAVALINADVTSTAAV